MLMVVKGSARNWYKSTFLCILEECLWYLCCIPFALCIVIIVWTEKQEIELSPLALYISVIGCFTFFTVLSQESVLKLAEEAVNYLYRKLLQRNLQKYLLRMYQKTTLKGNFASLVLHRTHVFMAIYYIFDFFWPHRGEWNFIQINKQNLKGIVIMCILWYLYNETESQLCTTGSTVLLILAFLRM